MKRMFNTVITRPLLVVYALTVTLFTPFSVSSQSSYPKREMRSTWLTTVRNVDWPMKGASAASQKADLVKMIDSLSTLNLNTVAFQVRCNADAFYQSAYEPWSDLITGTRGKDPGYDPLQLCIEECHKRGMACHAWLNPYRYNNAAGGGYGWSGKHDLPENYEHTHPEWILYFPNLGSPCAIMDPGNPEVMQRVKEVVGDIMSKYDIDGIIFDDYFYPYGGTTNQDSLSQRLYKPAGVAPSDWRRENVLRMVQGVYDTIQAVKPYVTFGISPFGIWTTSTAAAYKEGITLPAGVSGGNMYAEIYCDPVSWMKAGAVDYISPQLYWTTKHSGQRYDVLCPWWADLANRFGVQFYSSMSTDSYSRNVANYSLQEMQTETDINRSSSKDGAFGFIFFNTKAFCYDSKFRKAFLADQLRYPALQPAINWKPAPERQMVQNLQLDGSVLTWEYADTDVRFAVYAVPNRFSARPGIYSMGDVLLGQTYTTTFTLPAGVTAASHKIGVAVIDRYNNEYSLRLYGEQPGTPVATTLVEPFDGAVRKLPFTFRWSRVAEADSYILQFARDEAFQDIVFAQEMTDVEFSTALRLNLSYLTHGTYYWRVKTRIPNAGDTWSEPFSVTLSAADALEEATAGNKTKGVWTVMGTYLGSTVDNLPQGVYIINGKKVLR